MKHAREHFLLAANMVVIVAVVFWLRGSVSLAAVVDGFGTIPFDALLATLILNITLLVVYGIRLATLIEMGPICATKVSVIGFGLNGVLPFRFGELFKLAYAQRMFGLDAPRLLAATATEKVLDLCALLFLGLIASRIIAAPYLEQGILVTAFVIAIATLAALTTLWVIGRRERRGQATHRWLSVAVETIRAQGHAHRLARLFALTAIVWAVTLWSVHWMFGAVFPQLSLAESVGLTLVLALAIAVPGAPAGVGLVEASITAYLMHVAHAETNLALACAIAFHAVVAIPQVLIMSILLLQDAVRNGARRRARAEQ